MAGACRMNAKLQVYKSVLQSVASVSANITETSAYSVATGGT